MEYVHCQADDFVICGSMNGDLIVAECTHFKVLGLKHLCDAEIVDIVSSANSHRILAASLDGCLHYLTWDHFDSYFVQHMFFYKLEFQSPICSMAFDPLANEAVVGLLNGGLFYTNVSEKYI